MLARSLLRTFTTPIRSSTSSTPSTFVRTFTSTLPAFDDDDAADFRPEPCQADDLLAIGTRSIFSSDHDMFRESTRKWIEAEVVPHHAKWEEDGMVDRELWNKAGEQGLLGMMMPSEYGGADADVLFAAIVWEEQSYSLCTGPGWALHSEIVCPYVLNYGNEDQKSHYLPKLCSGEMVGAIAMTEPAAGSDLSGMRTTAIADGDDYILNGSKTYITNGFHADVTIVCAKTAPEKGAHGISLFLVESDLPGFSKGQPLKKLGMKAQDTCELFFDDVRLPKSALLGKEGAGFYMLMGELPQERLLIGVMGLAAAEAVFEQTRTFVKERMAFGKPIASLQTIQHNMAEMKTELAVGRTFIDRCLELHNIGKLDSATASMSKYYLSDLQNSIIDKCLQLHGGAGYMWEYSVARAYADARVQQVYGGTNEIMKELIARTI